MDAVHLMRSFTGRDLIIKVEGCYHGHHDSVQVSVMPDPRTRLGRRRPAQVPSSSGIPAAITDLTLVASFNDLGSVARLLDEHEDQVAGMIVEPIMMNAGIIPPEPGYPAGPEGPAARPRRAAHLRRGQDRPDRRPGRRDREGGGDARPDLPCQVDRRGSGGRPPSAAPGS